MLNPHAPVFVFPHVKRAHAQSPRTARWPHPQALTTSRLPQPPPPEVAQFVLVRTDAGWRAAVRCGQADDGGALVAFAEDRGFRDGRRPSTHNPLFRSCSVLCASSFAAPPAR
jgi:hypothetical protein